MKKNFFKKLASVLSLALVVTSVPYTGASAAAAPSFAKTYTNVYEGTSYSYNVKNVKKGYTVNWSVSGAGKSYASVSAKKGTKTTLKIATKGAAAAKNATVKVTYKVLNAKKKAVKTATDSVTIKVKATAVDVKGATGVDLTKVPVNTAVQLNSVLTPSNATDKVVYTVADKDGKATTGAAVDVKGSFKATTVGTYKVTATAGKATKTVDVVVAYSFTAKQSSITKVELTFNADVSKVVTKDNLTITDVNNVKQPIKEVKFSADGKTATAEVYATLVDKITYNVAYSDVKASFVASNGAPVKVVVSPKTVQYGLATAVDVKLFDANGVDVSTTSNVNDSYITFDYDNTKAYITYNSTDKNYKITMFDFGKTVDVKATYHTWKYANNAEVTYVSDPATFTSVEKLSKTSSNLVYTVTSVTSAPDWATLNSTISANKTYKLSVKGTNQDGNSVRESDCDFTSTDSTILAVNDGGSNGAVTVYGNKVGTAYVKCTYGDTTQLLLVTVGAASDPATIALDNTSNRLYTSTNTTSPSGVTFTATVKDQYGNEMPYNADNKSMSFSAKTGDSRGVVTIEQVGTTNKFKAWISSAVTDSTDGTSTFTVTYYGKTITFNLDVVKVSATNTSVAYQKLDTNTATVDAAFDTTTAADKTIIIKAFNYNSDNQLLNQATNVTLQVKYKGTVIATSNVGNSDTKAYFTSTPATGELTFFASNIATGNTAATGTYTVELLNSSNVLVASAAINVKNTQSVYTASQKNTTVSAASLGTVVCNAIKFYDENGDVIVPAISGTPSSSTPVVLDTVDAVIGTAHDAAYNANTTSVSASKTVTINSVTIKRLIGGQVVKQTIAVNLYVVTE